MSNLMVYPAEIAEMSVNQLAALPHAKLLEATTNLDELLVDTSSKLSQVSR